MKKILIWLVVIVLVGLGVYYFMFMNQTPAAPAEGQPAAVGTTTGDTVMQDKTKTVIGTSVGSSNITAYHYYGAEASSTKEVLFVGGIHGGYEWNTSLVAFQLMDYLQQHPDIIPAGIEVTVIPVLNPDGLSKVVGTTTRFAVSDVNPSQDVQVSGRFNGNAVDLNRNFDCDWQAEGKWQDKTVSGGSAAFSEPESAAMKQYIESSHPAAVVVWYSSAGGVFSSNCHNGVLPETSTLTKVFADASGYPAHESFDYYAVTGDMTNWLAKIGTPSISVLLTNHTDTEWSKNLAGVKAVLQHYAK